MFAVDFFIPVDDNDVVWARFVFKWVLPEEGEPVQCFFSSGENFLFLRKKSRKEYIFLV